MSSTTNTSSNDAVELYQCPTEGCPAKQVPILLAKRGRYDHQAQHSLTAVNRKGERARSKHSRSSSHTYRLPHPRRHLCTSRPDRPLVAIHLFLYVQLSGQEQVRQAQVQASHQVIARLAYIHHRLTRSGGSSRFGPSHHVLHPGNTDPFPQGRSRFHLSSSVQVSWSLSIGGPRGRAKPDLPSKPPLDIISSYHRRQHRARANIPTCFTLCVPVGRLVGSQYPEQAIPSPRRGPRPHHLPGQTAQARASRGQATSVRIGFAYLPTGPSTASTEQLFRRRVLRV